ncbi:MAG: nitrile hydratase subunit beta [Pseudomonadota bacterium]
MDGVHDMGGMHGFGKLPLEENEPVFHEEWEGRMFALNWAISAFAGSPIDAGRAAIEQIAPAEYLRLPYFGRWFHALCTSLVASGLLSQEQMSDIQAGTAPANLGPLEGIALRDGALMELAKTGSPPKRQIDTAACFAIGEPVRARLDYSATHTRLPRYVRGRLGEVVADRGGHVFPDSNAIGEGENPQRLYAVRFMARDLWGEQSPENDSVTLDLWEPYLESI